MGRPVSAGDETRRLVFGRDVPCPRCYGSGGEHRDRSSKTCPDDPCPHPCRRCGGRGVVETLRPIPTVGLTFEDRHRLSEQVRAALVEALRPEDGGVGDRRDLGSFAGHGFGAPAGGEKGMRP